MTPPIKPEQPDLTELANKLGSSYDYSQLESAIQGGAFAGNAQAESVARGLVMRQRALSQIPPAAPTDMTRAVPTPVPSTMSPSADIQQTIVEGVKDAAALSLMLSGIFEGNPNPQNNVKTLAAVARSFGVQTDMDARASAITQQFAHDLFFGYPKAPTIQDPAGKAAFDAVIKPITSIGAMYAQGWGTMRLLGWLTKLPAAAALAEQLPVRLKEIGAGAVIGGVIDAARPDGLSDPPGSMDVSGRLAAYLASKGLPDRAALGVSGMVTGGAFGGFMFGIAKGFQSAGDLRLAGKIADEDLPAMRQALTQAGVTLPQDASKFQVAKAITANLTKIAQNEKMASLTGDLFTRQQHIANEIFGTGEQATEDARVASGIFRNNPSGTSIVEGVTNPNAADEMAAKLGVKIVVNKVPRAPINGVPSYDLVISRPGYEYPAVSSLAGDAKRITKQMNSLGEAQAKNIQAAPTNESFLLADGTPVRGGFDLADVARRTKLQVPTVSGVTDITNAVKQRGNIVRMTIGGTAALPEITMELPNQITAEQFRAIGKSADAMRFAKVTVVFGDQSVELASPVGAQVQDAIAGLVKPTKLASSISGDQIKQFARTGVFNGQAAVLADGSPVSIVNKSGPLYTVQDPLTKANFRVHPSKITVLPTTLTNEFQPSNLFMDALPQGQQEAFAKLRANLAAGFGNPISKFTDLQKFANARGFFAFNGKAGAVTLQSAIDGESLAFKDMPSAIAHLRKVSGPMAELTPDEMSRWLGGSRNLGLVGGGGQPPMVGETLPPTVDMSFNHIAEQINGTGPGVGAALTPTRGLMLDLDRKSQGATELFRHFENIQSGTVGRNNFLAQWFDGSLPGIDKGVMPLAKIRSLAGANADAEKITSWLEVAKGGPEQAALEATMGTREIKAAQALRGWYDALFKRFGITADYIENYAPMWRQTQGKFGNLPSDIWSALGNDPKALPSAAKFFADYYRQGGIDIYDTDAFRVAASYLRAGAHNRFLSQPWQEAKDYAVLLNSDQRTKAYAQPFISFLLATRGAEFSYQRRMIGQTLQNIFEALPGTGVVDAKGVDKLTNYLLGVTYSSVLGMRPALAIRNAIQPMLMAWPIIPGGDYWNAVGRALTSEGKMQAMLDRAIDVKGPHFAHFDEAQASLPTFLQNANNAGMYLYNSADEFTRAVSYWTARTAAERALVDYAAAARAGLSDEGALAAKRALIRDSGMHIQEAPIQQEFLRRAVTDPQSAAGFAGKQFSDVTNFLYGRGMQSRWIRSVPGRLLGQFGTWSMWYIDYLRRVTGAMVRGGYTGDAVAFLGRHALANAAIIAGGAKLGVDLSRWVAYGSAFYSGGPAFTLVGALSDLMRGTGSLATGANDPQAEGRVKGALQTIGQTLPSYVPFYYAGRDAVRLKQAQTPAERLAYVLSTRPTAEQQTIDAYDIVTGRHLDSNPVQLGYPALQRMMNELAAGKQDNVVDLNQFYQSIQAQASPQPTSQSGSPHTGPAPAASPVAAKVPQPKPAPNEVVKPAEAPPIQQY